MQPLPKLGWRGPGCPILQRGVSYVLPADLGPAWTTAGKLPHKRARSEGGSTSTDLSLVPAGLGEKNTWPQGRALQGILAGCALVLYLPLAICGLIPAHCVYWWFNNCHASKTETTPTRHDILNLLVAIDAYGAQRVSSFISWTKAFPGTCSSSPHYEGLRKEGMF